MKTYLLARLALASLGLTACLCLPQELGSVAHGAVDATRGGVRSVTAFVHDALDPQWIRQMGSASPSVANR